MAKTPTKRAAKKTVETPTYTITVTLGTQEYKGTGTTITDAFEALERPTKILTKGFFKVEGNGLKYQRMFMPQAMRSFLRPMFSKILARSLERAMKPV